MNRKWVDNEVYFGPDRRTRGGSKRWGDRRAYNDAGDPPPLGAVLRRLRVRLSSDPNAEDRHHAMQLLNLAIAEADSQQLANCAATLRGAAPLITADRFEDADRRVMEAMALFSQRS
jgi:hypothetical protein